MTKHLTWALAALAIVALAATACGKSAGTKADTAELDRQLAELTTYESEGRDYIAQQLKQDKALKQTKSGLVYKITNPGSGEQFKSTDVVNVTYVGSHTSGEIFDQSGDTPVPFNLGQVVPGFREMILMMRPGAEAHCILPPAIAYGDAGNQAIAPNETLVFDIKTLGVAN